MLLSDMALTRLDDSPVELVLSLASNSAHNHHVNRIFCSKNSCKIFVSKSQEINRDVSSSSFVSQQDVQRLAEHINEHVFL